MAQVGIREYHAKKMLASALGKYSEGKIEYSGKVVLVTPESDFAQVAEQNPWLNSEKLVVKPDQLFGKRGKHGLIGLKLNYPEAQKWIAEKSAAPVTIGKNTGMLTHFIIEPFIPHDQEYYVSLRSERERDIISFSTEGGVEIEENWGKVTEIPVDLLAGIEALDLKQYLPAGADQVSLEAFIKALYHFYADYNFSFLEINPFAIVDGKIIPLDMVGKLDDTAVFECSGLWGKDIEFPTPFGRGLTPAEEKIKRIDENTGSSLKLTILNPQGKVWTMVAGGGASVIYADTVSDLGFGQEMANYGEYSGDPSREDTRAYAETILELMTKDQAGKALIIGGGIANFTDVAKTFTGIIEALNQYQEKLREQGIKLYVRRGGPNYEEGLKKIKQAADDFGISMQVYGPETHMTSVVKMAVDEL